MTKEEFIETYQLEDGCIILESWEDYKGGIVGVTEDRSQIIYSYQAMVESLARAYEKDYWDKHKDEPYDEDRFSEFLDEATEWIDYNTLRALPYKDVSRRPIIMIETELEEI